MSSTREKVEAILQDFLPRLEALKEEALAEIAEIRKDAAARVSRHEDAREELADVEAEISALEARKEELPVEVTRANLDEEYDREFELREEYRSIRPRLDVLEDRRGSLKEEMAKIAPRASGAPSHHTDASRRQYSRVAGTAAEERRALEHLQERLVKALDDAVGPVVKKHEDYRGLVAAWGEEREWDPAQKEWLDKMKAAQGGGR